MDKDLKMNAVPPISVITPCYNDGQYLEDAIASAELCDRALFEHIIINDGSTDPHTLEVLNKLEQRGYHIIHQNNKGLAASRNAGISQARGRYILPLDADNKIRPEYLTTGISILDKHSDVDAVYADLEYFGEKTGRKSVPDFDFASLLRSNYIDASAVFRKDTWKKVGGYDESMYSGLEDWEFWIRIAASGGRLIHVNEVLFDYRIRDASMSVSLKLHSVQTPTIQYLRNKCVPARVSTMIALSDWWPSAVQAFRSAPFRLLGGLISAAYFANDSSSKLP